MTTNPLRAGQTRCLPCSCSSSEGPTPVQVYWLYPSDNFSNSALFATADSATALTSITTSGRQLLPSFPVQPHGWTMEVRNAVPCSCYHSSQGAKSPPLLCYKRHPAESLHEVDQMVLGSLSYDPAKYVYNGWYLIQQVTQGTVYSLNCNTLNRVQ